MIASGLTSSPFLEQFHKLATKLVKGQIPLKCPYLPGEYYVYNVTVSNDTGYHEALQTFASTMLPNGIYRNIFRVSFPGDPGGVSIWNQIEHNVWNNDNSFKFF